MAKKKDFRAPPDTHKKPDKTNKLGETIKKASLVGASLSTSETVSRLGSASAEYVKGYTGIDNETGQAFDRSLKKIAGYKISVDPIEGKKQIKQQAGFSAEVGATSRDNADAIINKSRTRSSRSEDVSQYGENHPIVDRVQLLDGKIIAGSQSQMKFVGNRDALLNDITKPDGKFARYRGVKLELPSEQYEGAAEHCRKKAETLRHNAQKSTENGKLEAAQKLRDQAENYDQLAKDVRDSGLSTKDAIFYRKHPKIATALDIARTSNQAGIDGAKYGALINGCISLLVNSFDVAQEKKQLSEAVKETAGDTVKGAAIGYSSAFVGSAIKGAMQQSSKQSVRIISKTNAPALALHVVISLVASVRKYVAGEISEEQLLGEIGEKGVGMLSSGMMAALGQLAIPVPFLGAAIGGMIGYSLSSIFYQSALEAAKQSNTAKANLVRVREIEVAARAEINKQCEELDAFMEREFNELQLETQQLFIACEQDVGIDAFSASINRYAELLGAQLQFKSQMEFDAFMADKKTPLQI